jgi:hypothetical protein
MCADVIPAFEKREVAGLMQIDLLRRCDTADDGTVEFTVLMLFDTTAAIERFAGGDATLSRVPGEALPLLARYDTHSVHHTIIERRVQPENARGRP